MKRRLRILSLIMTTLLLCVLLCACGSNNTEPQPVIVEKGKVFGKVLSDDGDMMIAGIIVIDEENNAYRATTNAYGAYTLFLYPGDYTLIFTKGAEFSTYTTEISVESLKTYYRPDVRLTQLEDTYSKGWIAGDFHQHSYYSDGIDNIDNLVLGNAAAGLYFGYLTDHNTSRGVAEWRLTDGVTVFTDKDGNRRTFNGFDGVEVTTEFGHIQSIGTAITFDKYEIGFTEQERASSTIKETAREKLVYIANQIARQGGIAQINHPYSTTNMGVMNFIAEDDFEFFDLFSTMEIWNGYFIPPDSMFPNKTSENQNNTAKLLWFSTLNQIKNGHNFIAATGGSDNHDASGAASAENRAKIVENPTTVGEYYYYCYYSGKYSGVPTTYVRLSGDVTEENVAEAIKKGHSFISNGPTVICTVGDKSYGETVEATNGAITLNADVFNRDGLKEIRIVKNGEVAKVVTIADKAVESNNRYLGEISVEGLNSSDWIVIEVVGAIGQFAITNPIFIA